MLVETKPVGLRAEGALGMVSLGGHFASGQPALSLRFCRMWNIFLEDSETLT